MSDKDELAALKKKVEELEAKVSPRKSDPPQSERETAEWIDEMHQMRERRMAQASNFHPDDLRAMDALTHHTREIALRDGRAPTGPSSQGVIPSTQQVSNVHVGGKSSTPGFVHEIPYGPQPGIDLIDRGVNAALPHGPGWGKEKKE
jgi:hypothetical protein